LATESPWTEPSLSVSLLQQSLTVDAVSDDTDSDDDSTSVERRDQRPTPTPTDASDGLLR